MHIKHASPVIKHRDKSEKKEKKFDYFTPSLNSVLPAGSNKFGKNLQKAPEPHTF